MIIINNNIIYIYTHSNNIINIYNIAIIMVVLIMVTIISVQ